MKRLLVLFVLFALVLSFTWQKTPTPYVFPILNTFPEMPLSQENPVTNEGIALGRYLFYDSSLSLNNNMSCASCHRQEYAFSDSPNTLSTGNQGIKLVRNTPPLFNLAWYKGMFWDGRAVSIEQQVFFPVRDHKEMNLNWKIAAKRIQSKPFYRKLFKEAFGTSKIDSTKIAYAIAQFERTLLSYNSKYDRATRGETILSADEYAGFVLMNDMTKGDCLHCHTTDGDGLGTTGSFSNNGLDPARFLTDYLDPGKGAISGLKQEIGQFKIPSLRNVAFTAPYMHDGRFKTLEEVLDFYSEKVHPSVNLDSKMTAAHQGGVKLSAEEKRKIICFLRALSDSTFIQNPEFSNPWVD